MATSTVFTNNRTQAVRLPAEMRFSEEIKQVNVRAVGNERIISPITETWNSFFKNGVRASPDFMADRALQEQAPREAL
ncbi:MAG: type II toxin-antitoxin system VapB family antitoxin [Sideroxyarcus sp.]|nr:type II toxin-antitoxin system VapB family antitoxin [Sideroxyarcus sp.]